MQHQAYRCCNDTIFWIFKPSTTLSGQPCPEGPQRWCNFTLLTGLWWGHRRVHLDCFSLLDSKFAKNCLGSSEKDGAPVTKDFSTEGSSVCVLFLRLCLTITKSTDRSLKSYVILFPSPPTRWLSIMLSHHLQSSPIDVTTEHWKEH